MPSLDPNARLCAYHDARQVEVLDLHQTALPIYRHYDFPALDAKWRANLFLAKWLAFCARQGYRFGVRGWGDPRGRRVAASGTPICPGSDLGTRTDLDKSRHPTPPGNLSDQAAAEVGVE